MLNKSIRVFSLSLLGTAGIAGLVALACNSQPADSSAQVPAPVGNAPTTQAVDAFPKLTFDAPVDFTYANDGTNRVFVVEQAGRVRVFDNAAATASADVYLDIRSRVSYGGEMGLLGLAFHPKFNQNGYLFVNYTKDNPRETIVSRFKAASTGAMTVDPASEVILFRFAQPYANHNGGQVMFGPDGLLYVATGDGGSGGDPQNNGQSRTTWLGKILRVDVDATDRGTYGIPKDNPFAGNTAGYREEIFAYGLRNPWRFSFDAQGQLWTGDVGQNQVEEIDIVQKGGNYGWRIREASQTYNASGNPATTGLIDPVHEYTHGDDGNSITGGLVYRGKSNPALLGKYIFGDFGSGRIWALSHENGKKTANQLILTGAGSPSAFGEDQQQELYICDYGKGKILKIKAL